MLSPNRCSRRLAGHQTMQEPIATITMRDPYSSVVAKAFTSPYVMNPERSRRRRRLVPRCLESSSLLIASPGGAIVFARGQQ